MSDYLVMALAEPVEASANRSAGENVIARVWVDLPLSPPDPRSWQAFDKRNRCHYHKSLTRFPETIGDVLA